MKKINPNLCKPLHHHYNEFVKNRQIHFERKDRDVTIHIAGAIMCSKCGDLIFPEFPHKIKHYDLDTIMKIDSREKR